MLTAVITHPEQKNVFPVYAEPIANSDGAKKNDCERNACKRLLPELADLLPGVPKVAVLDALYGDGPTLLALKEQHMDAIVCIKEGYVLQQVERLREQGALKQLRVCGTKQSSVLH